MTTRKSPRRSAAPARPAAPATAAEGPTGRPPEDAARFLVDNSNSRSQSRRNTPELTTRTQNDYEKKSPPGRYSRRRLGVRELPQNVPGGGDVARHLVDEGPGGLEPGLAPQVGHELDPGRLAVKIVFEVEQVGLEEG
jgi:hypothetical protein